MQRNPRHPEHPESHGRPHVQLTTLGSFVARIGHNNAPWRGGGLGARQLRAMLSYLLAAPGRMVHWTTLAAIASPHWRSLKRPRNLLFGLHQLLRHWRMAAAFREIDGFVTLQRHPSWIMDTDLLTRHMLQAAEYRRADDLSAAVSELRSAAALCGGIFLPEYDVPEYSLTEVQQHWEYYQRDVLHQCTRLLLRSDRVAEALPIAQQLDLLAPETTAEDDDLLADVYVALGNVQLAGYYRRRANEKRGADEVW